ncbi:MAG: putative endonuclease [Thermoproteota archaeon]|nr:putative endonuclease [Thermoproteota archaeon]
MGYYVYILLCSDGSYYTGYTGDLNNRLEQHLHGKGARYTRWKKAEKLVYKEQFEVRVDAMRREREIKHLTHKEKSELANEKSR